jgi:LPXTG-motif cell wall-anchored protein
MQDYSLPRKIWRIIYPALIFVGVVNIFTITALLLFGKWLDILWCTVIAYIFTGAVLLPIWFKMYKNNYGYTSERSAGILLLSAGLMVGGWFLFIGFIGAADIINRFFPDYMKLNNAIVNDGTFLSQFFAYAIAAPIIEEICFRGIILKRMLKWLPVWPAVIIQAMLFGIVHLNLFQGIYAMCVGIIFGVLYTRFRSICVTIAAHFGFNITQVMITAMVNRTEVSSGIPGETGDIAGNLLYLAIGIVLFSVFGFFLLKRKKAEKIEFIREETAEILPLM